MFDYLERRRAFIDSSPDYVRMLPVISRDFLARSGAAAPLDAFREENPYCYGHLFSEDSAGNLTVRDLDLSSGAAEIAPPLVSPGPSDLSLVMSMPTSGSAVDRPALAERYLGAIEEIFLGLPSYGDHATSAPPECRDALSTLRLVPSAVSSSVSSLYSVSAGVFTEYTEGVGGASDERFEEIVRQCMLNPLSTVSEMIAVAPFCPQ